MAESKGPVGVLNSIDDAETPKTTHPRMPSTSFPIPLPGRNRYSYGWSWRQRTKLALNQTGNANGAKEKPTLTT
ncbi:hypothetical protein SESBI_45874 [Sesbania bispinosa]|nr:hypothetical protein SESBI_45874 [Sesbania bispinosa]